MASSKFSTIAFVVGLIVVLGCGARAVTGKEYKFHGAPNGVNPQGGLVADGEGDFYGTTIYGGLSNCAPYGPSCGTVFKMVRGQDGTWNQTVIYKFRGVPDGEFPSGDLILDSAGNLYGTAAGGQEGLGAVFRLSPVQSGGWMENVIYSFQGSPDGSGPTSGVTFDSAGNLYGTTQSGTGQSAYGTVFKLTPNQGGGWTETTLYNFLGGQDGSYPSGVVLDTAGNLYGSTVQGGVIQNGYGCGEEGCGTVFELSPSQNGGWTKTSLYAFNYGLDGAYPSSGVILDNAGNLYGEASEGGSFACPYFGCGVVYELTPESGGWTFTVAHTFNGLNGSRGQYPGGGLVFDGTGSLYGTTIDGGGSPSCGNFGCGTIFKLSPKDGGFAFTMIGAFNNVDGSSPVAGVIVDAAGHLYGTTFAGGDHTCECGVVFEITP